MTTKTDTKTSSLIINELTKDQYTQALEEGQINEDELYLVTGEEYTKGEIDKLVQDTKDELQSLIDTKPDNTDVVHKDGLEVITGQKVFQNKLSNTYEPADKSIYSDGLYVNTELVGGSLAISNAGNDTTSTSTRECDLIIDRDNCANDSNMRNQVKFQISSDGSFKFAHTRKARNAITTGKEDSQMGFNAEGAYWFGSGTKGSPVADAQYKYPLLHTGNLAQINLENYCKGASQPINNPSEPTGNTIKTTAKTLFGAINELYDSIQSGGKSYEAGEGIDITDNTISVDEELRNTISDNTNNISTLDEKIKEMELFKSPNAIIVGEPTINNGQVSNLSKTNYLVLPFQFDPKDRAFELTYCFRTGTDVTTPQNLYGSKFSIASYVSGGKLTIRVSSNGTSWNVLDLITSLDVQPNTTYYIKLIFNRLNYVVKSSNDGVEYTEIGRVVNTGVPFAGDVYIGIGNNQNNPFLGTINLNKWELKYNNSIFWEGMDDAGLATRADISLSNLDEEGQGKFDAKQDVISDLETIRSNAQTAVDTISTYGDIVTHDIDEFQPTGDYATNTDLAQGLATKQDIISDLETIRSNAQDGKNIIPQVNVNTQRIEDLTTAKFPNVVIVGTPHIEGGQVSNYSDTSYLQFPFVDISRGQPFDIYFSFTTAQDVTTQQNILDAYFGIALAIQNSKGIMALSSNGTSWDIGTSVGTNTLLPNTTYYVKYSWTGTEYSAALSTDEQTYVPDMNLASTLSPHKTTIFIGGSPNIFGAGSAHPFKGTINFNKSKVVVNGITVWEGMADVGLASRANVSLNNLDEVGERRFNAKQDVITDLATIRDGAKLGATALQSFTETDPTVPSYVKSITQANITDWDNKSTFSGDYNDLTNKPTIPTVDQTYNGTSANAQSGIAVASAISGKADVSSVWTPDKATQAQRDKIVSWGMPNYTAGVQKANGGTYTESVDGVLIASSTATSGEGRFDVTINNITFNFQQEYRGTDYPHITNGFFPIPKNTSYKIKIEGNAKVVFYPLRRS